MCYGVSCEVGKIGDEVKVWFGDPTITSADIDSHNKIREFHKLPEVTNSHTCRRTPIEMWPVDSWTDADKWHLHFDESKPEWWDDSCESKLRSELHKELRRRNKLANETGVWAGSIKTEKLVIDFPFKSVGGDLYIYGSAKLEAPALESVNGKPYRK